VATRFQGQGLGTALLRPALDRSDRERVPAYLEASTERSAALYERLGFIHLGELRIPDGGPPFWPMLRPRVAACGWARSLARLASRPRDAHLAQSSGMTPD
jgi:RimJ/RimL family protein N-acetyltransferase